MVRLNDPEPAAEEAYREPTPRAAPVAASSPVKASEKRLSIVQEYESMRSDIGEETLSLRGYDEQLAQEAIKEARGKFTFKNTDANADGLLSRDEFTNAALMMLRSSKMQHLEDKLTTYALDQTFEDADMDGNGSLSEEEFFIWYNRFHEWIEKHRAQEAGGAAEASAGVAAAAPAAASAAEEAPGAAAAEAPGAAAAEAPGAAAAPPPADAP